MGHSWISILGSTTLLFSLALAWWKGSWAERLGAMLLLFSNVSSDVAMALTFPHEPEAFLFIIDMLLAIGLLILALRYSSLWLGLAMFLQSIALCAHALRLSDDGMGTIWWMVLNNVISQLMLVCIVIATALSWRARRKPPAAQAFVMAGDAPVV